MIEGSRKRYRPVWLRARDYRIRPGLWARIRARFNIRPRHQLHPLDTYARSGYADLRSYYRQRV